MSAQFAGGDVDNWHAYALNDQSHSPVPWTADALFAYLRDGFHPDHGTARGPMAEVVSNLSVGAGKRRPRHRGLHGRRVRRAGAGSQADQARRRWQQAKAASQANPAGASIYAGGLRVVP